MTGMLADAAFGDDPGRWPLPQASTAEELWLRAVAAGGQGRYGTARADLTALLRRGGTGRLPGLAFAALGSFLRQQGWHQRAAHWDGLGLARSGGDLEAGVDALAGLAADALGVGRLAGAAALLRRAEDLHDRSVAPPARLGIRLAWVAAELAMAGGRGDAALAHARRAVDLVTPAAPALRRHQLKSQVVLAAALCSAGHLADAREVADAALTGTDEAGLVPLRWALACLLTDIGSEGHDPAEVDRIRADSAAFVTRHGGCWNSR